MPISQGKTIKTWTFTTVFLILPGVKLIRTISSQVIKMPQSKSSEIKKRYQKYLPELSPQFKADMQAETDLSIKPSCLDAIITDSNIVVIGKFEEILQHRHNPRNSYSPVQNTIYEFGIESYLKGEGGAYIKIFQSGGPLPWQYKKTKIRGQGYKINENPFPLIGNRYILFLRNPALHNRLMALNGYLESTQDGIKGITQYADEFNFTFSQFGKVLLREGKSFAGQVVDSPDANWELGTGRSGKLQVTNISEKETVENIRRSIAYDSPQRIRRLLNLP